MESRIIVTLAIGLSDKTWIERDVEIDGKDLFILATDEFDSEKAEERAFDSIPEDEANQLCPSFWKLIHWEWKFVKDEYEGGLCPDCQQEIPDDASAEESCSNCGHVWSHSTKKQG